MTLNNFMEKFRSADVKTVIKVTVIVVTSLWVIRELLFWTELHEYKNLAKSISSDIRNNQKKIEKAFGEDFDKNAGMIQSEGANMESEMHKNINNLMEKRNAFFKDFSKGAGEVERRMEHGRYQDKYQTVESMAHSYIFNINEELKKYPGNVQIKSKLASFMPIYKKMAHEMMRLGMYTDCQEYNVLPECSGHSNAHWEAAWDVPQRKKNWEIFWSVYLTRFRNTHIPEREIGKPYQYSQQERDIWEKPACLDLPGGCDANNNPAWSADKIIEAKERIAAEKSRQESEKAALEEASGV